MPVRLIGLLSYLLLGWLAVRFIPFGKWLLAILITAPMALFQASTISADTISNGIGFLFLGGTLAIANKKELGWKEWGALVGLIVLLFLAKVNLVFLALLPFLLIPPSKFKMKHGYILLGVVLTGLVPYRSGRLEHHWPIRSFTRALEGADPTQQILFILSSPLLIHKDHLARRLDEYPGVFARLGGRLWI